METRPTIIPQPVLINLDIIDIFDLPFNSAEGRAYIESMDRGSRGAESWHVLGSTVYHCKPYQHGERQLSAALRLNLSSKGIRAFIYISQGVVGLKKPVNNDSGHPNHPKTLPMSIKSDGPMHMQHDGTHFTNKQHYPQIVYNVDTLDVLRQFLTEANSIARPSLIIPQNLAEYRVGRSTPWYNATFFCQGVRLPRPRELSIGDTRRSQTMYVSNPEDCDYVIYPLGDIEYSTLYCTNDGATLTLYHLKSIESATQYLKRLLGPNDINVNTSSLKC